MTKTVNGKTYELVSNMVQMSYGSESYTCCNCYKCDGYGSLLCGELGNDCIGKGVWKEVVKVTQGSLQLGGEK